MVKRKVFKLGGGQKLLVKKFIGKSTIAQNHQYLADSIFEVTNKFNLRAEKYLDHWFTFADAIIIIEEPLSKAKLGVGISGYFKESIIYLPVLLLDNSIQYQGVSSYLRRQLFKDYIVWRIKNFGSRLLGLFQPFYVVFRTDNPLLYKIWHERFLVYPNVGGIEPTKNELKLVNEFVRDVWPESVFDEKNFVLKDEFDDQKEFFRFGIPWSGEKRIDRFVEERLQLSKFCGNALVILVKIPPNSAYKDLTYMTINRLKFIGVLSSIATVAFLFIISEGWLISSVYLFGPYKSFIAFTVFSVGTCLILLYVYNYKRKSGNKYILKVDRWIEQREAKLSKFTLRIIRTSKTLGILFSSITAGPLPTTILILVLGYRGLRVFAWILAANILFFLTWIAIYS